MHGNDSMKILMVGLGSIGQRHLRNLRTLLGDDVQVSAYRVRRDSPVLTDKLKIEEGADLESKYGLTVFSSLDEALAQKPTAVFICNPNSMHMPVALAAAEAGAHLFIEKPLSHSLDQVDELIEIVERKKLVAFVTYQMRFHPCLQLAKEAIDSGVIGQVVAVRAEVGEYMPGWHAYEDYRTSYAGKAALGGGVVISQIHEIDYLGWLFGTPLRVFALGGHLSSLEIDVEDVASSLLDCRVNGRPVPVELHQDYVQRPTNRNLRVVGEKGVIVADWTKPSLTIYGETGAVSEHREFPDFQRNQLFLDELSHFLRCVEGLESPLVPLRDGASSVATALAIQRSIATGEVVTL
jgi:predicted dehydrogenase